MASADPREPGQAQTDDPTPRPTRGAHPRDGRVHRARKADPIVPTVILHGGAGGIRAPAARRAVATALAGIARGAWERLLDGESAVDVAVAATVELEDNPLFNAGTGSKLQRDGGARLSAALMDGDSECFSGVVNAEGLTNPIVLAAHLQEETDRVLCGGGALERAMELGLRTGDVRTPEAIRAWRNRVEGFTGTVGVVALDEHRRIAAATSTGGRGMERVGRVSDSATVAGNFASAAAGISCTGVGEDIVDGALAARLVSMVEAGMALQPAAEALVDRMRHRGWSAGFIALDRSGRWVAPTTTDIMYWVAIDGLGEHRFADPDQ
ncbi:MAG: isoaspartyl peptidase/L-asparaginase [Myxococcota bacterium]|nr:isoaspartyl peptidase/L-asparaginase [Myxococcota bacterium]